MTEQIKKLRAENRELREKLQGMRLVGEIRAGSLRLEAVMREGKITFTMCHYFDVMASMGENGAKLFAGFVAETLGETFSPRKEAAND